MMSSVVPTLGRTPYDDDYVNEYDADGTPWIKESFGRGAPPDIVRA